MTLQNALIDREQAKFKEDSQGDTAVRVCVSEVTSAADIATETTLSAIKTELESIKGFVDQLEGFTDGLESLNQQILDSVDGLEGFTDGIEPALAALQTTVTAISGFVDGLEGFTDGIEPALAGIQTSLTALEGYVDGIESLLGQIRDKLPPLKGAGVQGAITVTTSFIEARVGASALAGRRLLTIQSKGNGVFWGRTTGVTTASGTELYKDQTLAIEADDTANVYLIASSGSINVRITESA